MNGVIIATWPIALLIVLAIVGIPLWMTLRHRHAAPDHREAGRTTAPRGQPRARLGRRPATTSRRSRSQPSTGSRSSGRAGPRTTTTWPCPPSGTGSDRGRA